MGGKSESSFGLQNSASVMAETTQIKDLSSEEKEAELNQELNELKSMALPKNELEENSITFNEETGNFIGAQESSDKQTDNSKNIDQFKLPTNLKDCGKIDGKRDEPEEFQDDEVFESEVQIQPSCSGSQ